MKEAERRITTLRHAMVAFLGLVFVLSLYFKLGILERVVVGIAWVGAIYYGYLNLWLLVKKRFTALTSEEKDLKSAGWIQSEVNQAKPEDIERELGKLYLAARKLMRRKVWKQVGPIEEEVCWFCNKRSAEAKFAYPINVRLKLEEWQGDRLLVDVYNPVGKRDTFYDVLTDDPLAENQTIERLEDATTSIIASMVVKAAKTARDKSLHASHGHVEAYLTEMILIPRCSDCTGLVGFVTKQKAMQHPWIQQYLQSGWQIVNPTADKWS